MKKLISLLLVSAMVLMCTFAAYADDAQEVSPYGIPLYTSAQDVDLEAVIKANSFLNILNYFENVCVNYHLLQVQFGSTIDVDLEDTYFHDGDMYVFTSYDNGGYVYKDSDPNDNYEYVNYPQFDQKEKFEMSSETFMGILNNNVTPYIEGYNSIAVTNAEEKDGLYCFTFNLELNDPGDDASSNPVYSDCSVTVDPATGLIKEYTYNLYLESSDMDVSYTGNVEYDVDVKPDYSLKF